MAKYSELNLGQIEAVINKLGGMEGLQKFLRGEITISAPVREWREEGGVIYFTLVSDGTTGPQWIERLGKNGFYVDDYAKHLLNSSDFKSTSGIKYEIAVLKGTRFIDNERIAKKIRAAAEKRKLEKPNAEVACLIREKFSDAEIEAMGLRWVVVMHEPIKESDDNPRLLEAGCDRVGQWLYTSYFNPGTGWSEAVGFAFVASTEAKAEAVSP